jgi:hypothetical protein
MLLHCAMEILRPLKLTVAKGEAVATKRAHPSSGSSPQRLLPTWQSDWKEER